MPVREKKPREGLNAFDEISDDWETEDRLRRSTTSGERPSSDVPIDPCVSVPPNGANSSSGGTQVAHDEQTSSDVTEQPT